MTNMSMIYFSPSIHLIKIIDLYKYEIKNKLLNILIFQRDSIY